MLLVSVFLRQVFLADTNKALTYIIKKESLIDTIQVSGIFTTALQKQIVSPTNGIIAQLYVSNNDQVKKGDPLFHVASTATEKEKNIAYANYQNAVSAVKKAEQTKQNLDATMWTKQKAILDAQNDADYRDAHTTNPDTDNDYTQLERNSIDSSLVQARKDFAAAEQTYKEADIAVDAAQAQLLAMKRLYDETQNVTVIAPVTGMVVNLSKEVGDEVFTPEPLDTTNKQTNPLNPTVLILANFANPVIKATINESYVSDITLGQKVKVVFDGMKNKTFTGSVANVDSVGTETQGLIVYNARILLDDLASQIKPNMTALIDIETLHKDDIFVVPNSAILFKEGKTYIKKAEEGNALIAVIVGKKGITKTEITSGLREGDIILANVQDTVN